MAAAEGGRSRARNIGRITLGPRPARLSPSSSPDTVRINIAGYAAAMGGDATTQDELIRQHMKDEVMGWFTPMAPLDRHRQGQDATKKQIQEAAPER